MFVIYLYNIITMLYKACLEASESASVSADHHDKKSVLCIGCKVKAFNVFGFLYHKAK